MVAAILRNSGYVFSAVVVCLGYWRIIWDENEQEGHDTIANPYVVKA